MKALGYDRNNGNTANVALLLSSFEASNSSGSAENGKKTKNRLPPQL
jgi:hypothetical protein